MIKQLLTRIEDWPERAEAANYCVHTLAKQCGVSVRALERFFVGAMGKTPKCWLHDVRMKRARELLLDGSTVKETSILLAYHNPYHFSRDFKTLHGYPPSQHSARITRRGGSPNANCRI